MNVSAEKENFMRVLNVDQRIPKNNYSLIGEILEEKGY